MRNRKAPKKADRKKAEPTPKQPKPKRLDNGQRVSQRKGK